MIHQIPASLFVEESGGTVYLHFFDKDGLPLGLARERKLEQSLLQGELRRVRGAQVVRIRQLELTQEEWAGRTVEHAKLHRPALRRLTAAVGEDPSAKLCSTAQRRASVMLAGWLPVSRASTIHICWWVMFPSGLKRPAVPFI